MKSPEQTTENTKTHEFITELAKSLTEPRTSENPMYKRANLDPNDNLQNHNYFGANQEKRELLEGAFNIVKELEKSNSIVVTLEADSGNNRAQIGRTPDEFNPTKDGQMLPEAGRNIGENGTDYLMMVTDDNNELIQVRYLSEEQVDGVEVKPGTKDLEFNPRINPDGVSGTLLRFDGTIKSVLALE